MADNNITDNNVTGDNTAGEDERPKSPIEQAFLTRDGDAGELILVRHGQQVWPDQSASNGEWINPPLSELGLKQADAVADYLATEPISAVYSSNLDRANVTGQRIAERHRIEVEVVPDLAEFHFYGQLDPGDRPREVLGEKIIRGTQERFVQTRKWDSFPASESSIDFRRRVGFAVEAAVASHPGERVVVACHGGVINAYMAEILGLAEDMFFPASHASVHRVRYNAGRRVITSLNEDRFLGDAGLLSQ